MIVEREWTLKQEESLIPRFGDRVRHARVAAGFDTQKKFQAALRGKGVDIGISMISDIERGDALPSHAVLLGIAKVLDRSLDWLCVMPEQKPPEASLPVFSPDALEIADRIDSLPPEIKRDVVRAAANLIQDCYDKYDLQREFSRLINLVSENGDRSILENIKRIIRNKNISNIVQ